MRRAAAAPVTRPRERTARPSGERLRERRKRARRAGTIGLLVILVLLVAIAIYVLWLPQMRIASVEASGPRAEEVKEYALASLGGRTHLIFPKNSIFLFPKEELRENILASFPEVSALSIARSSFSSIEIRGTARADAFLWCGYGVLDPLNPPVCYEADAEGLVFKEVETSDTAVVGVASGTPMTTGDLRIYAPLDAEVPEGESFVGRHVEHSERIPNALRFVKAVRELGVPVVSLVLREDEGDLWVNDATRITYVLGHEEEAAFLATSVIPELTLTDGTIQYLDLRFSGKAYVKRYGE